MFGKLLLIVVTLIGTGAVLLVLRHERIERMHEITRLHEAIDAEAARLRGLRSQVAAEITPDRVRELMRRAELAWVPVPAVPGAAAARTPEFDDADGDAAPVSVMALLEAGLTPADAIAALHPVFQNAAADVERLAARTPAPLPSNALPVPGADTGSDPAAEGAAEAAEAAAVAAVAAAIEAEAAIRTDHRPAAWIGVWPPRTEPTVLPRSSRPTTPAPEAVAPETSTPADSPRAIDPDRS